MTQAKQLYSGRRAEARGERRGGVKASPRGAIDATSGSLMLMLSLPEWLHSLSAVMRGAMRRRPFALPPFPRQGRGAGRSRAGRSGRGWRTHAGGVAPLCDLVAVAWSECGVRSCRWFISRVVHQGFRNAAMAAPRRTNAGIWGIWGVGAASRKIKKKGVAHHANHQYIATSTTCTADITRSRNGVAFT